MSQNSQFKSKIGLIAATVGSAVGLGNIWRFPSEAQQNGGAAFLLLYILCVLILGIPVMLSEFSIGRAGGSDAVTNYRTLHNSGKWYYNGWLSVATSYIICIFYMVVAGWTLEYLYSSITGALYAGDGGTATGFTNHMNALLSSSTQSIFWTVVMIFLNIIVLVKGVNKGIEKISNILMPILFIILLIFAVISISLPNAQQGIEFFFRPDFSKITATTFVKALGQAFFSLSLGMGILVTYAGYYPSDTNLTRTSITVSVLGFIVAVLMGIIIFPAATSFGLADNPESLQGTTLVFVTLPEIFAHMPGTWLWSCLFFLLLAVATFTSTISICEVTIRLVESKCEVSRIKACLWVLLPILPLSSICALSFGCLSEVTVFGETIFDFLNDLTTNYMLPVSAFVGSIFAGWVLPKTFLRNELTNNGSLRNKLCSAIIFAIRYIAPTLIALILIAQLF